MPGRNYSGGGSSFRSGNHGNHYNSNGARAVASAAHPDSGDSGNGTPNGSYGRRNQRNNHQNQNGYRKQWGIDSYLADDENYPSFQAQLSKLNLQLRDIPADG